MTEIDQPGQASPDLEQDKLKLERYKADLAYKKFIFGSGSAFAVILIAFIPSFFKFATEGVDYMKTKREL